jgi:beta-N-acetylhexosaminidase
MIHFLLGAVRLAIVLGVLPFALYWRTPPFANHRLTALALFLALPLAVLLVEIFMLRRARMPWPAHLLGLVTAALATVTFLTTFVLEARFRWIRHEVLRAEPARLETFGRHFIVGYRSKAEAVALIERRAIAGLFLSGRNIRGRSAAEIRAEIDELQTIRARQGLPPLMIAADQEGGLVSRLSPPLTRMPPLAELVASHPDPADRRAAVQRYAAAKAQELASLGVTINFAPVVDLNHRVVNPDDRHSRIHERAISTDPAVIAEVADTYCTALHDAGVRCTLKHFPGLGRVFEDTHRDSADLTTSLEELARSDWVPFRRVMQSSGALVMLGHVRLTALDAERPVSFSRPVVEGLIRRRWGYAGLLITDDFSMGAVQRSSGGIAAAGVAALKAGVDLILISYDNDQYYFVMHALLAAARDGRLKQAMLSRSVERLARATGDRTQ